jgi:hypothetical protein
VGKLPHCGPGGSHYGFAVGDWADIPVAAKPSSEKHYLKELHKPDKKSVTGVRVANNILSFAVL